MPALAELWRTTKKIATDELRRLLKSCLPRGLKAHLQRSQDMTPGERFIYLSLLTLRALGLGKHQSRNLPPLPRSILFVCHGNIIRSPMTAALLKSLLPTTGPCSILVESAGLHTTPDRPADARALLLAKDFGTSLDDHHTQPVTQELVDRADAIFVMDFLNEARILARYPKARHKVFMLGAFPEKARTDDIEIADPYEGDIEEVRRCYQRLSDRVQCLARFILSTHAAHRTTGLPSQAGLNTQTTKNMAQ